jgi:hypothetical protein
MKNIDLFIGHFIDSDTKELPIGVSFAGNYYQKKVRSILNINHSLSIFFGDKGKTYESNNKTSYIVLRKRRYVFNFLCLVKNILKFPFKRIKNTTILFYNLNIYSLFYFISYILFTKARVVVLLTDAGFLLEKNIISQIISKALSYSYGILTLREISDLRKFKSKVEVMPGIILKEVFSIESKKIPNTVLLSGSLGITTGLLLALEYFSNQSKLKLIITGVPYLMSNIEFERILEKYKSNFISYLGVLDYKDYINVLTSSEFSLSLRNPKDVEHQYNFPSKILEYLSYGNIVISSLKYPEIFDNIYFKTEFSINGLNECFEQILGTSGIDRELLSTNARNFVKNYCSEEVLKAKIYNLFE